MNVKSRRKRIFEACIILMMAVLAVCTVTFTAVAEEDNSSYSLIIRKIFDYDSNPDLKIPDKVREEAESRSYTFKITGTRIDGSETVKVDEMFTLPRTVDGKKVWESEVYKSNGPFNVIVTELTDTIDIKDGDGNHYNMSDSTNNTSVTVNNRRHEVQLRNNSILTIARPNDAEGPDVLWYRVTNRTYDEHPSSSFEALDMTFSLAKGENERIEKLCAAIYTIEQIAAPDGYQIQMGNRTETVEAGKTGHFHINGTPGRLTLTAGGSENDGAPHFFIIERTEKDYEDTSEFVTRKVSIASGEKYVLDDLPKGGYTVTEYSFTGDANTGFSVTVPQTTEKKRTAKSSAPQYEGFRTFALTEGTTYFKLNTFGPLYDANSKKINDDSITYEFAYGWGNAKGGVTYSTVSGTYKANTTYTLNNAAARHPETPKIGFRTQKLSSDTAKQLGVSWTEYMEKEVTNEFTSAGVQYTKGITLDNRGWMTITSPAVKEGSDMSHIVYYYTIRNSKNELVTGAGGETDRPDTTTVMLKAGESVKLEGLAAGSYKITENVEWQNIGFTMQIEGYPFGTTETGKEISVQVGGQRDLTIRKPAVSNLPDGAADNRTYEFIVSGTDGFNEKVSVKAGESRQITLPEEGSYTVKPQSDMIEAYELKYIDSGAVYGTVSGSTGDITFTNVFSKGEYGYRYIHEYYVREADGSYTHEGNSQITTRLGRKVDEKYQARDISQSYVFNSIQYKHFDEAYGWVDPVAAETPALADSDKGSPTDTADSEEADSSDEDGTDSTDSEETDPADEDNPDSTDDEEGEAPDGDTTDPADDEEGEDPDGDTADSTDSTDSEETEPADGDNSDSADGEGTESSGEDTSGLVGNKETESPGEDALKHIESVEVKASHEKVLNVAGNGGTESSGGESKDSADSEATETPDGEDPDTVGGEATETPGGEDPDTVGGEATEAPGGEDPDTVGGEVAEAPDGEDPDTVGGEATETLDGEGSDTVGGEATETPDDEGADSADSEGTESSGDDDTDSIDSEMEETSDEKAAIDKKVRSSEHYSSASYNSVGIIDKGVGVGSNNESLNYGPESDKDHIMVTKQAEQIIILRYYRDRRPEGKYNVIHVYYRRDENGDHWEGISGVRPQNGELGIKYTGNQVQKETDFKPEGAEQPYAYVWDGRPQYGVVEKTGNTGNFNPDNEFEFAGDGLVYHPNNDWTAAEGTEEGNQIIILRYYREPKREGYYNIIHEYYLREKGETGSYGTGRMIQPLDEGSETGDGEEDGSDVFTGTLNRNDGYVYTFEGNRKMVPIAALLGSTHTAVEEDRKLEYEGNAYTYIDAGYGMISSQNYNCDPNRQWAVSTEDGDEVVILRYYRELDNPPPGDNEGGDGDKDDDGNGDKDDGNDKDDDGNGDKDDGNDKDDDGNGGKDDDKNHGDDGDKGDHVQEGTTSENGNDSHAVKLSNTEVPDGSVKITVPDEGQDNATVEDIPETGDDSRTALWMILAAGSLCGLIILKLRSSSYRKRTDQQRID